MLTLLREQRLHEVGDHRSARKAGARNPHLSSYGEAADSSEAEEATMSRSARKIKVGVVGGGFGAGFWWHEHPNCTVEAVSDPRPDRRSRLQERYRCDKTYDSLEALIQDKNVDAVAVFSGAPDHVPHTVACMNAGKHVFCAVPACISLEQAEELRDTVRRTGLTYMMAESSYYHAAVISARNFLAEGKFGDLFYSESEYHHAGLETLWFNPDGSKTWRHGFPPMLYPTHCTAYLVGVTRERLASVMCVGWGHDDPGILPNAYNNPFLNETALFKTDKGNAFRVAVFWYGAHRGTERGQWYGTKMSLFDPHPNGLGSIIVRTGGQTEKDDGGFLRQLSAFEPYALPEWWKTDMLPEPLRRASGHGGSAVFLTHEFIDALVNDRPPAIDVYESLAMTVPGIVAHQSALEGGRQLPIPSFDLAR
ncbi:MAG: Gfo/Idh/MocA family oxidoreductase [Armatimonadetes bacterium]|nr:Gfo/Idh/MocA family oxidoreductase [Armatimonadota bacterium]